MPSRNLLRGFLALWMVSGVALLAASVETVRSAVGDARSSPHLALLAGIEAASAALFLIPRAMRVGAAGLLATLLVAFIFHAAMGQFRWDLLVFGVAVLFVDIHGPLTREQLGAAAGLSTA